MVVESNGVLQTSQDRGVARMERFQPPDVDAVGKEEVGFGTLGLAGLAVEPELVALDAGAQEGAESIGASLAADAFHKTFIDI